MASLLEITLNKLQRSVVNTFPDTKRRQHDTETVGISKLRYIPYEGSHQLKIESVAISGSKRYDCSMIFDDVYFEATDSAQTITFFGNDERDYHVHPIDPTVNDVKVRCTCMDFYYRFAQTNYQNNGLDGDPPPQYIKRTDREPVNPENAPGLCKHLIKMREQLEIVGLLR